MLLTSKDANKLLKQLNSELDSLKRQEGQNKLFPAANIEDVEAVRPEYDYRATQKKINEIEEKIIRVKHAINKFNVETGIDVSRHKVELKLLSINERICLMLQKDFKKAQHVEAVELGNEMQRRHDLLEEIKKY